MKLLPNETMDKFMDKMKYWKYKPTKDLLTEFVREFFDKGDSEFEKVIRKFIEVISNLIYGLININ